MHNTNRKRRERLEWKNKERKNLETRGMDDDDNNNEDDEKEDP